MATDKTVEKQTKTSFNTMQKAFEKAMKKTDTFREKVVKESADSPLQKRRKARIPVG